MAQNDELAGELTHVQRGLILMFGWASLSSGLMNKEGVDKTGVEVCMKEMC
jgi:hypothetical protein